MKRKASFGDIVKVNGMGGYYKVDGYEHSKRYEVDREYEEVIYDLTNVRDVNDFIIAWDEDIEVVASPVEASDFLRMLEESGVEAPKDYAESMNGLISELFADWIDDDTDTMKPKEIAKSARKRHIEKVDGLLDEYNDVLTVIEMCGTDGYYEGKKAEILSKLRELTNG